MEQQGQKKPLPFNKSLVLTGNNEGRNGLMQKVWADFRWETVDW